MSEKHFGQELVDALERLEHKIDMRFDSIDARLNNFDVRLSNIENRIAHIDENIRKILQWVPIENSDFNPEAYRPTRRKPTTV